MIKTFPLRETMLAASGVALTHALNTYKNKESLPLIYGAAICAGSSVVLRISDFVTSQAFKKDLPFNLPMPTLAQRIISCGLAIFTTFKVMELAKIVLFIHPLVNPVVSVVGYACLGAVALGTINSLINKGIELANRHKAYIPN